MKLGNSSSEVKDQSTNVQIHCTQLVFNDLTYIETQTSRINDRPVADKRNYIAYFMLIKSRSQVCDDDHHRYFNTDTPFTTTSSWSTS